MSKKLLCLTLFAMVVMATSVGADTIEFAEGTYYITSQINIKDGVTYLGGRLG